MSDRITQKDLYQALAITRAAAIEVGIEEAARWQLSPGSKTYGRAYRLWLKAADESFTGQYSPLVNDFLGMTKAEAFSTLNTLRDGFNAVYWAKSAQPGGRMAIESEGAGDPDE